jgi:hypothetical protein
MFNFKCDYCNDEFKQTHIILDSCNGAYTSAKGCASRVFIKRKNNNYQIGCYRNSCYSHLNFIPIENTIIKFKHDAQICDNCISELIITNQIRKI